MRFKFLCTCGKHLAAYSWMAGKILECPKCGTILTVPKPEDAGAQSEPASPTDQSVPSPYTERQPMAEEGGLPAWAWVAVAVAAAGILVAAVWLVYTRIF